MDKKYLQSVILENKYNPQEWRKILQEYFSANKFHIIPKLINLPPNDIADSAVELGSFYTKDERLIGLYEVQLKQKPWIQVNRVGLRSLLKHVYKYDVDAALIVFVQDEKWRFSFVSEIGIKDGKKETEPKRYTYLFGKGETSRTGAERFDKLKGKDICISDLYDAFNVEKLNKEFFDTYKDFFLKGVKEITENKSFYELLIDKSQEDIKKQEKPVRDFVKKMLGRIVFLHFLQKKGWMGCSIERDGWYDGDKDFMINLFTAFKEKKSFYSKCLTELFFNTLNNANRKYFLFKHTNTRVPYLNGGLFDDDQPETNGMNFSVEYFKSLFEFFQQYNFTIDENDPYDSEVGIDPEMLGHIFENLLEENKDKGTYYTPKEIVQYICEVTLIEYLIQRLNKQNNILTKTDEKAIENLIRFSTKGEETDKNNFVKQNATLIEKLLDDVKICDPAIGSGAFPMGIMQEIFNAKMCLDWTLNPTQVKKSILQKSIYGVDIDNGAIEIARLRFWLALVVDEDEPQPLPNLEYKIMQGDSLKEEFEGIKLDRLLKNIEFTFVNDKGQGDLYGSRKYPIEGVDFSEEQKIKLKKLLDEFYEPRPFTEKKLLQKKIDRIILNHIDSCIEMERLKIVMQLNENNILLASIKIGKDDLPEILHNKHKSIELYKKKIDKFKIMLEILAYKKLQLEKLEIEHDNKPYFLWHVFFEDVLIEGGFDIIIGNPPYGAKLSRGDKTLYKELYEDVHMRTPDTFNYFISKSLKILKDNGVLSFIVPNNLLFQNENTKTRSLLINNNHLKNVINLGDNTFESADVPTCIFVTLKEHKENYYLKYSDFRKEHIKNIPFFIPQTEIEKTEINQVPDLVLGMNAQNIRIMQIIERQSWKIDDIALEVASGISTGGDKIFRITKFDAKKLQLEEDLLHRVLVGGEIDKYKIQDTENLVIYIDRSTEINKYPNTKRYLSEFRNQLEKRSEAKMGIMPWYSMNRHRYPELFEEKKIIMRQTSDSIRAALDENGFYALDSILIFKLKPECEMSYKFVVTILNSKVNNYIYKNFTQEEGRTFAQVKPQNVRKLFIPRIPISEQRVFEVLCDYLMFLYDNNNPALSNLVPNTHIAKIFEEIIDGCVYELYFSEHMREKKIDILNSVREIFKPVDKIENRVMKAEIINEVFKQLRISENQIRNRTQLFVSSSPDFLKEIIQN